MFLPILFSIVFAVYAQSENGYSVYGPNDGERVHALPYPNGFYRILVQGNETNHRLTMIEGLVYRNEGARTHYHMNEDESFLVINGSLQFYVDGRQFCAQAGTTVFIPRNITQSVRNVNSKAVHVQILFTPSGREEFLRKVTLINDQIPLTDQLKEEANQLAKQYGQINLPEVQWNDLNCYANNHSNLPHFSSFLLFFSLLLFFS